MHLGPCAKRHVRCTIISWDARAVTGENLCANPQPVCPREPGEGYEKCHSICKQVGHAEEVALDRAIASDMSLDGALVVIAGHERVCESCMETLQRAGVSEIMIGNEVLA